MRVSAEDFRRGVVSWPNPFGITLCTKTAEKGEEFSQWSAPLPDPLGSLVASSGRPRRGIQLGGTVPEDFSLPEVRWNFQDDRGIVTKIWPPHQGHPSTHRHILGHGYTHRIVVHTPHLLWSESKVIWSRNLVIRFTDSFSGIRVHPHLFVILEDDGNTNLDAKFAQDAIYEGRFIEIVATESNPEPGKSEEQLLADAKAKAMAALGLVARNVGTNALHEEVVLSHGIVAFPNGLTETRMEASITQLEPVTEDDLAKLDSQLDSFISADSKQESLETALHWYLQGLTAESPRDKLIAHYIATEGILRRHASAKKIVAIASTVAEDEMFPSLLEPLVEKYGRDAVTSLIGRCKNPNPPDWQCMDQYSADHGLNQKAVKIRSVTRKRRNPSSHGGRDSTTAQDAIGARVLAELVLDTELQG